MTTVRCTELILLTLLIVGVFSSQAFAFEGTGRVASHDIEATVDLDKRTVTGTDTLTLKPGTKRLELFLRSGTELKGIRAGSTGVDFTVQGAGEGKNLITVDLPRGTRTLELEFGGEFTSRPEEMIRRGMANVTDGVLGPRGAYLPSWSYWYPREKGETTPHRAEVTIPKGYSAVTEGELTEGAEGPEGLVTTWVSEAPIYGLNLVVGRYVIEKRVHRGVEIYTYFYGKDEELSKTYLDKTEGYLDTYIDMFGPYPFTRFSVVESFLPTGYGMPGFTLLGSAVIRLPFIPETSLGHEIVHSWWGNCVRVDEEEGNWAEALTTHTADHLYARRKSPDQAAEFRSGKLRGYRNFAGEDPISLREFTDPTEPAKRSVGYNKGLMVFNMLERLVGPKAFSDGLKVLYRENKFTEAGWSDIQRSMEAASGEDLGWFFDQWVSRAGGPELKVTSPYREKAPEGWRVGFTVEQKAPAYRIELPVVFTSGEKREEHTITLTGASEGFEFILPWAPDSFEVDPLYQNFRVLSYREVPPSLASCFGDKEGVVVVPSEGPARTKYLSAARMLSRDYGLGMVKDTELETLSGKTAVVLGGPGENKLFNEAYKALGEEVKIKDDAFTVEGEAYPADSSVIAASGRPQDSPDKSVCILAGGQGKEQVQKNAARMRHFAKYGYLVFGPDRAPVKGEFEVENALSHRFTE